MNSRRYSTHSARKMEYEADVEAIHILMGASRGVFEDYAGRRGVLRRVADWLIERVVGLLEMAAGRWRNVR